MRLCTEGRSLDPLLDEPCLDGVDELEFDELGVDELEFDELGVDELEFDELEFDELGFLLVAF